jgi:hypothetical protein
MSFYIYLSGALIVIGGLVYGAILLGVPNQWIAVGVVITVGLSVLSAVKLTRQKDASASRARVSRQRRRQAAQRRAQPLRSAPSASTATARCRAL